MLTKVATCKWHDPVPIKFYLKKQVEGQIWPVLKQCFSDSSTMTAVFVQQFRSKDDFSLPPWFWTLSCDWLQSIGLCRPLYAAFTQGNVRTWGKQRIELCLWARLALLCLPLWCKNYSQATAAPLTQTPVTVMGQDLGPAGRGPSLVGPVVWSKAAQVSLGLD